MEFVSLNGPDNAGKTTQIRLLSEVRPSLQLLGSVHEHAPHLWRDLPDDWWFGVSSTGELSQLLFDSHMLRAKAREPRSLAVLDRGFPMLIAAAVATCVVKDKLSIDDACAAVGEIQRSYPAPPAEFSILLLLSTDLKESLDISQMRDPEPWSPRYLRYQQVLHAALMRQVEQGVYDRVIEWGIRPREEIQRDILAAADYAASEANPAHPPQTTKGESCP